MKTTIKKQYHDTQTGDVLTSSERVSWFIQSLIRQWPFLIGLTIITAIAWFFGAMKDYAFILIWWNLVFSYLAIFIESVVGISMLSQTKRDALVLREIRTLSQQINQLTRHIEELTVHVIELDDAILKGVVDIQGRGSDTEE